jgi:glycine betaine/choline ABC-type transport system substrate-binding protein
MTRRGLIAAALGAFLAATCRSRGPAPLRIGSKNFSEQVLLAEILAQAAEAEGVRVERRLNLGGTFVCHRAITAGELDAYPEYSGTALTAILKLPPVKDPAAARDTVAREYARRWNLVWGPSLGFENTFALVMRGTDARRLGIRRISDLASHPELRPGFGYEFLERADGYPGLARAYGLRFEKRPAEMDLGLLYPALQNGTVDVVAGNSTDGLIAAIGGAVLEDDRHYFPPYEAAFVLRRQALAAPGVARAVARLAGKIDAARMRELNARIDRDKRRPEDVAREFLAGTGRAGAGSANLENRKSGS